MNLGTVSTWKVFKLPLLALAWILDGLATVTKGEAQSTGTE